MLRVLYTCLAVLAMPVGMILYAMLYFAVQ